MKSIGERERERPKKVKPCQKALASCSLWDNPSNPATTDKHKYRKMLNMLQGKAIAEKNLVQPPPESPWFPHQQQVDKYIQHHWSRDNPFIPVTIEEEEGYIENNEIRWKTQRTKGKTMIL
jgi:hypothetical protein